jgi:hypothetical protein
MKRAGSGAGSDSQKYQYVTDPEHGIERFRKQTLVISDDLAERLSYS